MLCSISGFLYSKFLSDLIPTFVLEGIGILYRRMPKCNSALQTEKFFFSTRNSTKIAKFLPFFVPKIPKKN